MKVLVIGSGGREHALAWKLAQSPKVSRVYIAPGNGGTGKDSRWVNVPITSPSELAEFALKEGIALTVVGPEAPLAAGVVDLFRARGLKIWGPTAAAARLESSKAFAKAFMERHHIPTARHAVFSDPELARQYIREQGAPIVIKADGLAAGKGVVVAETVDEACQAVGWMLEDNVLGVQHNEGGARVVIEQFLQGEEASFIVLCDGTDALALATSQDHKRLSDGDLGPNTGGMGAYSPAPVVTPEIHRRVMQDIIAPTLKGMAAEGHPFTGFLYAGLMIDAQGRPFVIEYNARLGDPETQPIMMRLKSDLFDTFIQALDGKLSGMSLEWDRRFALGVVMAASGYPMSPRKGDAISGNVRSQEITGSDVEVFHAGTVMDGDTLRVSGGRVLCVTAMADTVKQAQAMAYERLNTIHFDGAQWRKDIGHRALHRPIHGS